MGRLGAAGVVLIRSKMSSDRFPFGEVAGYCSGIHQGKMVWSSSVGKTKEKEMNGNDVGGVVGVEETTSAAELVVVIVWNTLRMWFIFGRGGDV